MSRTSTLSRRAKTFESSALPMQTCIMASVVLIMSLATSLLIPSNARAATDDIVLEVGKGEVLRLPRPAAAVFVADPEIADVTAHSSSLVYLFGRRAGATTVIAVDQADRVLLERTVVVDHQLSALRELVGRIAPNQAVDVSSTTGGMVLSGTVADASTARDLQELSERYLGEDEVLINRLHVRQPQQVNLRVRVAEMSREATDILGFNWESALSIGDFIFGFGIGRAFQTAGGFPFTVLSDQNGRANALFGSFRTNDVTIDGIIDLLERENLISVLAEPNLTALSGETASFLAGGEFPVPVGRDDNEIEIEFKQFGVSLSFTPTVLDSRRISLRVKPEVSDLSDNGAVQLGDFVVPALSTRRAETTIELASGQSFAIGGLVSTTTRDNLEQLPGLGDIPVLGRLFRSTEFQQSETELVIIATPYLVRPVAANDVLASNERPAGSRVLDRALQLRKGGRGSELVLERQGRRLLGPAGFSFGADS